MPNPSSWIKRHQVVAFFVLTFAITWGFGFSYGAVLRRGQFLLLPVLYLATCGPALAGIILTRLSNTEPSTGKRRAFWIAFLVAWIVSALVFVANSTILGHRPFSPRLVRFAVISVLPVAFVIGMTHSRVPAVRRYLASLIRLQGVWLWSLLALGLVPGLILLSVPISSILGSHSTTAYPFPDTGAAVIGLVAIKFLSQLFFFNATGEETGWRGFALPRLQARISPLLAALVLALFWVPWHFLLWRAEGKPILAGGFWGEQYLIHILFSMLIVWIYNRSRGSILVAGIAHAAANTTLAFLPGIDFLSLCAVMAVAVLVLIGTDRMWAKLPSGHPAVYGPPEVSLRSDPEPAPWLAR